MLVHLAFFFFFKQKTAYDMRISDWSSDVCSSDLVYGHHDAGVEPAWILLVGGASGGVEIGRGHPRSTHQHRAEAPAIVRHLAPFAADHTELHAEHRPALLAFQRQTILCGQETVLGLQRRGKAQRAGLRHAPGLSHLHPLVVKSTDHDGWYRRPADEIGRAHV